MKVWTMPMTGNYGTKLDSGNLLVRNRQIGLLLTNQYQTKLGL